MAKTRRRVALISGWLEKSTVQSHQIKLAGIWKLNYYQLPWVFAIHLEASREGKILNTSSLMHVFSTAVAKWENRSPDWANRTHSVDTMWPNGFISIVDCFSPPHILAMVACIIRDSVVLWNGCITRLGKEEVQGCLYCLPFTWPTRAAMIR